ncbi:60s ribosomal protein l13a-4 [Quercus suber]|uniref:60s ribosomal protein l13a-4 n=1 Tax=Quercus suber TaxID=58331 RepID=A0AAW0MCA1_QUESU
MLGRLSSIIVKELLNNQKVVVVRCEEICSSGLPKNEIHEIPPKAHEH